MSKVTKIQWCHHTYNPWLGCRKVAPECSNCYIVRQTPLRVRNIQHGSERHRCSDSTLNQPFAWNRSAIKDGVRRRVFCLSLGDWADEEVPDEWRDDLFEVIRQTEQLDWLLLTKRPKSVFRYLGNRFTPTNVWLGVSAGVNPSPIFNISAKIYFLSCEPMLHALDTEIARQFSWVIVGGESGRNARQCDLGWIRDAVDYCQTQRIPVFVKQLGSNIASGGTLPQRLKDSHGGDPSEWPEDIRVRQFPK